MFYRDLFLVVMAHQHAKKKRAQEGRSRHSRHRMRFYKNLSSRQRWLLRQQRMPRCLLQYPSESAWKKVCEAGNDAALVTLTGLDFKTFEWLNRRFELVFDCHSPFISETA
jgi:hypothetical protein